ncbi:cysteine protease StiP family protein [Nocardioides sp. GXZ039]|uniref:cysteine protease StiP family protein n=1 Tax=Nocardioides sp. GXZ039 TaxID=3136018 RepID=UPI0030F41C98
MPLPTPLSGPAFGSYAADDVTWLLKDLSDADLEAPVEQREAAIQAGTAHYAESLPVEYQPSAEYTALFEKALAEQSRRVALAAAVLVHLIVDLRGRDAVLVSLARAGTPIGILLRRYARRLGLDLPHYTMSIVRGRGLDTVALRYLAEHHDPADVVFVDGWTGKGAISRELTAACIEAEQSLGVRFDPSLAVLADPGSSTDVYGTRDDFLIPSACLNSTVSGLVSRTVLNDRLIGPDDFHGAKFYAELAPGDVSRRYLDVVESHFDDVAPEARAQAARLLGADRSPTWSGWKAVEEVSAGYGIGDVNLVKPGVGETTRVLLRRVPWRVLVRPDRRHELGHVELLAEQRGVPVEVVDDLAFSCMGLIHPRFAQTES